MLPDVHISDLTLVNKKSNDRFLAYFDCALGFIHLYGCVLSINGLNNITVCGPLTSYKRQRAAYISNAEVLREMLKKVVPTFVEAGGVIPAGTGLSDFHRIGGTLDEYFL